MKKFTSSIITLREDRVRALIKKEAYTKPEQVIAAIHEDLYSFKNTSEFKNLFPEKWIPTTFQIVREAFSDENQMINSALKMVRHKICEVYKDRIDFMYNPGGNDIFNEQNIKAIEPYFE